MRGGGHRTRNERRVSCNRGVDGGVVQQCVARLRHAVRKSPLVVVEAKKRLGICRATQLDVG